MFTVSGNNGGMVVDKDYYLKNKDSRNEGVDIVDKALDNADLGFSVKDNVEMMVQSKMGAKIAFMQAEITNANVQKGAIAQYQSTLKSLLDETLKPLDMKSALTSYAINNSDPSSIGVTVSDNGTTNNLNVALKVNQLASSESLTVGGFKGGDTLHAGVITFDFGSYSGGAFSENKGASSVSVEVTEGMSLDALADKINLMPAGAIKATVVERPDGTRELAVMSSKSGENNSIRISATGSSELTEKFNYNGSDNKFVTERQKASDAKFTINGIEMTSESNVVKDVMGLNLSLNEVSTREVRVSTSSNPDAVIANVNAFVQNVNSLQEMLNKFNSPNADKDFVGAFKGTEMSAEIDKELSNLFDGFRATSKLAAIGISRDAEGKLTLDSAKLKRELVKNPEIVFETLGSSVKSSTGAVDVSNIGDLSSGEHELIITRKPEKAKMTGAAIGEDVVLGKDTSVKLEINGKPIEVNLPAGSYTSQQIATKISSSIQAEGIQGFTASYKGGSIVLESEDYGSLQRIEVMEDVPELGLIKGKESGVDISGTLDGEPFLGDGASYESRFNDGTKGFKFAVDPETVEVGKKVDITVSKGLLLDMKDMYASIDKVLVEHSDKIQEKLKETSSTSLLAQLEELKGKEDYYYNFYYQQFSGVSAMLSKMKGIGDMLDAMFNNKDSN